MPDIGTTLREARMRARIDISEIESETKIRAKYLRALENEEWDLLPGPTYVKSFLRTYADALGLDGKLLIEEYKLRHERLSDVELQPIAPPGQRDRDRRRRARGGSRGVPRGWLVAVVVAGLVVALYFLGSNTGNDTSPTPLQGTPAPQTTPGTTAGKGTTPAPPAKPKPPAAARLTVVATGQVYVCLKAAGNRTLVGGLVLTNGGRKGPYRSSRFRLALVNGEARLLVDGKPRTVPAVTNGVGYEITPRRVRTLPRSSWPRCRA
ncbi:MAG: cytoskeleton protein RodZ [Solirubrobacteraceae bacterium]|jgi:cytoskeletal protein RodZ|nr:cytoskeleton protein RodZ [Solirubrobacteraceae bacterium]